MQEADLVAKMLRAVLQSHKTGVPFSYLQGEYKSLTGDWIPFKQLGHATLEGYLKSIPGVVRIEISKSGEVTCHAVVCQETARIAKLVACQRTSKKKSKRQVNCQMRLKTTTPLASIGRPKDTLRKPGFMSFSEEVKRGTVPLLSGKGNHTVVNPSMNPASYPLSPEFGTAIPNEVLIQGHVTMVNRPERRLVIPPRFHKELQFHLTRNVPLDINDNVREPRQLMQPVALPRNSNTDINEIQKRIKDIINRFKNGIWLSKIPHLYREAYNEDFNTALLSQFEYWPHVCMAEKVSSGGQRDVILYPSGKMQNLGKVVSSQERKPQPPLLKQSVETKTATLHGDFKQNIAAILTKYSNGLWANALPKVYEDTYKAALPQNILDNLDLLSDICTINYISENPKKAILYAKPKQHPGKDLNIIAKNSTYESIQKPPEHQSVKAKQDSQEGDFEHIPVPPLIIPEEISPSVLVVDLCSTNDVVVRYVGANYSGAQESMEEEMKDWYSRNASVLQIQSPKVGQIVVALAEEDAWLRAKIVSTEGNRIKVCYVDYGFNEIIEISRVYKLAKQFYRLPFQASKCKLAGLEAFDDPILIKMVESQTCGKIFAVEILEKSDIPRIILYDTSGDDDININATCLKVLQDKSLELHLQVDALYKDVRVTNVCSDGTLYCQVPSKGLIRLSESLQKLENYFHHRQPGGCSVSLPFCGMICLLNYKGKWARVEIISVHSSRTLDVRFMDTGTVASVKVLELREIPSIFLREIIAIPPQAIKCCLADLPLNIGMWTPDAVLWLRDTVLNCPDCSMKVVKLDNQIAHIYLFTPKNFPDPDRSINRQITSADLWKHQKDVFLSSVSLSSLPGRKETDLPMRSSLGPKQSSTDTAPHILESRKVETTLNMPPALSLVPSQEQMDVFVALACHPGYFILQSWQEMHKLEMLMEEMLLYYNAADDGAVAVEKSKIYAAKVKNKWHRVLIKGLLANGLVTVYELDYGKHELIGIQNIRPLVAMFRELPFQAITAQLAGIEWQQWSEEASIVFRNHVEQKPLVAQVETVIEGTHPWDRKAIVYLVDTSIPDKDIWIHDIMKQL
ncbi:tudor domain-containing protein 7 [Protobothrops mucrosquamatus]|uniref:tudor domain-containing protein 7 n=1 Tax=Protobothrops mucrosquamatus TaxID=103944 RepID=UPI0007758D19|nr:tudor domain-containing protein 7 [Protobothrops mucrosquamatus]XP_029142178.1 tudor domain-containing protein 7 [Protobothrops mucrosquamatus]